MYAIVTHDEATAALRELPATLLAAYLEARAGLELTPWQVGASLRPSNPDANVYTLDIRAVDGDEATIYYLILEQQRTVHILEALWL